MMTQPMQTSTPFDGDNIPAALKANARWAPWRAVWNDKRNKFDKIPASARPPFYGLSTAKPERWFDYATALKAYQDNPERFAGVGYVMTGPHDVVGIDLDNCVHDGTIEPWAQDVINEMGSYTELSPSGRGLRILAHGSTTADWTNHERGIEVYAGHEPRFLTVTGARLADSATSLAEPGATRLEALGLRYAKAKTSATIISLEMPDLLDDLVLPELDDLMLPARVLDFLRTGENGGDRSRALFGASVALYNAGLADDEVFSLLATNPFAFEVALDHRRQDHDRALMYLWVEHCQKGKAKSRPVTGLADFESLAPPPAASVELHGDADDFDVIETLPTPKAERTAVSKALRFQAEPAGQFAHGATPTWLVKGVIPKAELVVLYGESGSGKSFVALDMGGAIARGIAWRGRKVRQGKVVYIAAEGATGFRKRLNAYAQAAGIAVADLNDCLYVVNAAPNLMLKDDALDLCRAIQACGKVELVIVDTLAQTMPGANENAGEDVGKALQHCKGIHRATGAMVLLVHHAGKDASKGARGWSGLRAACDAELEVSKTEEGRKIKSTKEKDDQDGLEWGFSLARVVLGLDEEGDEITSCTVAEAAVPEAKKGGSGANKNKGKWAARVLQVLGELSLVQTSGIERKAVLDLVVARSPEDGDATGRVRRQRASHALKLLLADDEGSYMAEDDGTISVIA